MSALYHDGQRRWQARFDTERLADRIEERLVHDSIEPAERELIEAQDMFFLATADADGRPNCSYKGGDPGFVRVVEPRTLAFPCFDGNGMFLSVGNLSVNPHVGLLFIDFARGKRVRVNGTASIDPDDPLLASIPGAQLIVRVRVREVFPNCSRYIHKLAPVERSPFVPRAGIEPPTPGWKRAEWATDVLPANDPARKEPRS